MTEKQHRGDPVSLAGYRRRRCNEGRGSEGARTQRDPSETRIQGTSESPLVCTFKQRSGSRNRWMSDGPVLSSVKSSSTNTTCGRVCFQPAVLTFGRRVKRASRGYLNRWQSFDSVSIGRPFVEKSTPRESQTAERPDHFSREDV